jgi:hypothetical protein
MLPPSSGSKNKLRKIPAWKQGEGKQEMKNENSVPVGSPAGQNEPAIPIGSQTQLSEPRGDKNRITKVALKTLSLGLLESLITLIVSRDSEGLRAGRPVFNSRWRQEIFSSPDRFWGPPSLLSSVYWGSFPGGKLARAWSGPLTSIYCRGQECWSFTSTPTYVFMTWYLSN